MNSIIPLVYDLVTLPTADKGMYKKDPGYSLSPIKIMQTIHAVSYTHLTLPTKA